MNTLNSRYSKSTGLLLGFFFVSIVVFGSFPGHAFALTAPTGTTIVAGSQKCTDGTGNTGVTETVAQSTGGSCTANLNNNTFLTVAWDAKSGNQQTVVNDVQGNELSKTTISGATLSAAQAQVSSQSATQSAGQADTSSQSAAQSALKAVGVNSSGTNVTVPPDQIAAMRSSVSTLQSKGLITAAEAATLNQGIDKAAAGSLDASQVDALNQMVSATNSAQQANTAAGTASTASTAAQNAAATVAQTKADCSLGLKGDFGACMMDILFSIISHVALFFLLLASFFLGLVGLLLNWTIYITVFQFGNLIGNNAGMLAAWGVLRDIGNILLLFGFIFMGVSTILNLPGSEYTAKRALPALIIFAILLNFSLFAAETVIDTSNALGATFYNQGGAGLCPTGSTDLQKCATEYGLSGAVMQISGIAGIFTDKAKASFPQMDSSGGAIALIGLTIFAAATAMVLLAAVFMLIARAITLAFLMVVSPIGFAGMAIPPLHKFATMWWDQLLKQAFFAPIYILLVLVSIKFMDGIRIALGTSAGQSLAESFSTSGISNLSMVVMFVLMIGFVLAATQAAKSMGAVGAGSATKWAGAAVFGGMARVTNFGVGGASRLGRMASRNVASRANPNTRAGRLLSFAATGATTMFRAGENVNTDLRRLPGTGAIRDVAGGPAEHATFADMGHQVHEVQEGMQRSAQESLAEANRSRFLREARTGTLSSPESQRYLAGLSAEQIAADHALQHAVQGLATSLSPDQFEGIMKSDKVAQGVKDGLASARFANITAAIDPNNGGYGNVANRDAIRALSNKDLEMLAKYDPGAFNSLITMGNTGANGDGDTMINADQSEALGKSNALTNSQRGDVYGNSRKGRVEAELRQGGAATAARYATAMASKAKAKLTGTALTNDTVIDTFTAGDLAEIQREGKLTPGDVSTIITRIRANPASPNTQNILAWLQQNPNAGSYWR